MIRLIQLLAFTPLIIWASPMNEIPELLRSIEGKWVVKKPAVEIYEDWKIDNTNEMIGRSWFVKNGKSTESESLRIISQNGVLLYIPTVHNQNDGKPVSFTLSSHEGSLFVFSNTTHDFPQHISYNIISKDSILASVYGYINGVAKRMEYHYSRVK